MGTDPMGYANRNNRFIEPGHNAAAITPSDTVDLTTYSRAIFVGVGGDVAILMSADGAAVLTFKNVPSGTLLPLRVKRVYSTNTTATNMIAVW